MDDGQGLQGGSNEGLVGRKDGEGSARDDGGSVCFVWFVVSFGCLLKSIIYHLRLFRSIYI